MTNKTNTSQKTGGYESLVVYWLAVNIYDLTVVFCDRYIPKTSRIHDQMVQASRSGKQNIVEGSLEKSIEGNLKLTGVSRASYGELLEDYKDYLRQHNLPIWDKDDPRTKQIRNERDLANKSYKTNKTYLSNLNSPENFANLMITLCYKESFLLDKLLKAVEEKFIREGGFRENLFKKRVEFRNQN